MAKQDMFGIGDDGEGQDGGGEAADYVILQTIPADGWRAVFGDPTVGSAATRTLGLACFALVEIVQDAEGPPLRTVRPMVVNEHGQVDDVELFEDFICVVPPGVEVRPTMDFAIRARETAAHGDEP